ncbi:MAG: hypothetical protein AAB968_00520, partial [Patescibacteria group bacterium]
VFSMMPLSVQAAPLCPLESDTRRTIVHFDGSIISGSGGMKETSAFVTAVPAGTYDITLVSYDDHSGEATQSAEQWFVNMITKGGSPIGWSNSIEDLPDGQQFLIQTVNFNYGISQPVAAVTAAHITVYDGGQHSIVPVCVAFDLKDGSPLVATHVATSITNDEATINGAVNPNGSSDAVSWFEWGATSFPLGSKTQERRIANSEHISERITGLKKNTQYYFRAAARNAANTSFGPTLSFITGGGLVQASPSPSPSPCSACPGLSQPIPPTVFTQLPTFVAQNTAVLNGHVNADAHLPTNAWFEWGRDANLGSATTRKIAGYAYSADFSDSLTGLLPDMVYYFRAVAENAKARSHGVILSFRTLPIYQPVSIIPIQPPVQSPFLLPPSVIHNPIPRAPITSFNQSLGLITFAIKPSDEVIEAGKIVPFEITFKNISNNLLTHAALAIMLPPELVYQDISGSLADIKKNTSINANLNVVNVQINDIAQDKSEHVTMHALLKPDTLDKKIFTVSATITYEDEAIGKGGKETVFAINTARADSGFAALLFAGGLWLWLLFGLLGLLLLLLIFFLLKRRKDKQEEKKNN